MPNYHIIDSGNSNLKLATFNSQGELIKRLDHLSEDDLVLFSQENRNDFFASCSVNLKFEDLDSIEQFEKVRAQLDFETNYSKQLGSDRFAIAYYIQKKYPIHKHTIINAGTFITVDFIEDGKHLGGYIFPGPQTYLNSFEAGKNLPVLKVSNLKKIDSFPLNTEDAITSSLKYLLDSILDLAKGSEVHLTGGASHLFREDVKEDKNLLFKSLFYIFINSVWKS